ncbi:hypothetical protein M3Y94_01156100 [Aphelenchoides besseyi]|nr:hypothetical protein M3Y94_01156100 [Aphelenchoides besseyi]KAI6228015.1 hypothetical protein M3Y95_00577800 [Aphelenchoides besseyi]
MKRAAAPQQRSFYSSFIQSAKVEAILFSTLKLSSSMAQVEEAQQQENQPVVTQGDDTSAASLEALSAAIGAVSVAMTDLSDTATSANPDQWDVIKAAADAPAIEAEKLEQQKTEETAQNETPIEEPLTNVADEIELPIVVKQEEVTTQETSASVEKTDENQTAESNANETIQAPEEITAEKVLVEEPIPEPTNISNEEAANVEKQEEPAVENLVTEEQNIADQQELNAQPAEEQVAEPIPSSETTQNPTATNEQSNDVPTELVVDDNEVPLSSAPDANTVELAPPQETTLEAEEQKEVVPLEESEVAPEDPMFVAGDETVGSEEIELQDQLADDELNSDIVDVDDTADQCEDMDEVSLDSASTGDLTSQKLKKKGRVMGGFRSIGSGLKDITFGTGRNMSKTTKRAATVGHASINKGATAVSNAAQKTAAGTASGVKAVGSGIKNTGKDFAKATTDSFKDVGSASSKVATSTKDVIVQGTCVGVGLTVLGAQALGHGAQRTAGAITDGTVNVATSVASGVKTAGNVVVDGAKTAGNTVVEVATSAGQAVMSTTSNVVHSVAETIDEAVDAGKAGIRAVEQGIETAAMKSAAAVQRNTVAALTMGLKMADSNLQVVPKAIAAKPADSN